MRRALDAYICQPAVGNATCRPVYSFDRIEDFNAKFDEAVLAPDHTFIVLRVAKIGTEMRTATTDGPEVKFRFGRLSRR